MKNTIKRLLKKNKGFTLIEMLIVLIVVGLLMAIIIPNVAGQKERIEAKAKENIAEVIATQVNTYELVEGTGKNVTLANLLSDGYITEKQATEAKNLLGLEDGTTITLPIDVD